MQLAVAMVNAVRLMVRQRLRLDGHDRILLTGGRYISLERTG